MYEANPAPVDPYSDAYNAPPVDAGRSPLPSRRTRSPSPGRRSGGYTSPPANRASPAPVRRPPHAPAAPTPSNVLGVFGLSIRTVERDLDDEFSRFGRVEKVTIVYDQRSGRSRGFGFIRMATTEDATKCIQELNGIELNGRRIRVDYSVTERAHAPTPGEYMGHRRRDERRGDSYRDRDYGRSRYDERDRDYARGRDRHDDRERDYGRDRDRDPYGRDNREWRDRRSPPPRSGRHSPEYRRRRSYSRSPPRGGSPHRSGGNRRDYDAAPAPGNGESRW